MKINLKMKRPAVPWKRSLRKSAKGAILLELSDRLLKLIQMREEGGIRKIVSLNAVELDSQEEKGVSEKIASLLKELPYPPGKVFASIPRSQITTRTLLLPSTQPAELARMVEFQIEKEIPFPKEKIVFDYHPIETTPEGYSRLLLVIAGEEVIRRHLLVLKRSGLVPISLFFSSEGLVSWFRAVRGEETQEDSFTALVDIDRFLTHVEVLHRGGLHFTRSFPFGARVLETEGEKALEDFIQELNRTFASFKKEFPPGTIDKIFFSGISRVFPTVQSPVETRLGIPVETILFRERCPIETRFVKEGIEAEASFSSAAGFLLREEKRIDLIPFSEKKARSDRLLRRTVAQGVCLLGGFLLLLGLLFGNTLNERRERLGLLQNELRELEPTAKRIESVEKQMDFLKEREIDAEAPLELLRELYRQIPEEVFLTYLVIEPDHVAMRGNAKTLSTVFLLKQGLESSPVFTSVRLRNATRRTLSEGEVTTFQMDASVVLKKKEER